jgi:hypothetical protein
MERREVTARVERNAVKKRTGMRMEARVSGVRDRSLTSKDDHSKARDADTHRSDAKDEEQRGKEKSTVISLARQCDSHKDPHWDDAHRGEESDKRLASARQL